MTFTQEDREQLVELAAALYDRGLTPSRTGNLSIRVGERILITPTGVSLGRLDSERLAEVTLDGHHVSGDHPSKEVILHRVLYNNHPSCRAVVHLHSPYAVAVSCLPGLNLDDALPSITPYYIMRVGRLPLVDYAPPGSAELEDAVRAASRTARCLLLRNHGTLAAAGSLESAVDAAEEVEATARLHLLLDGRSPILLTAAAKDELAHRFPSP